MTDHRSILLRTPLAALALTAILLAPAHGLASTGSAALTDLPQAGAVYGTVRAPHCTRPGHRTIAANRSVRVFYARLGRGSWQAALACRRSANRAFVIGNRGECQNSAAVDSAVVAGRYAAINVRTCSLTHSDSGIGLVNLRNGHVVFSAGALSTPSLQSEAEGIRAMAVTPRGRVAWLAVRRSGLRVLTVEVLRRAHGPNRRAVLLDRGTDIDPRSLRRRGGRIIWKRAGVRHSASM